MGLGLGMGVDRTGVRDGVREGVGESTVTVAVGSGVEKETGVAIKVGVSVGGETRISTVTVGGGVSTEP